MRLPDGMDGTSIWDDLSDRLRGNAEMSGFRARDREENTGNHMIESGHQNDAEEGRRSLVMSGHTERRSPPMHDPADNDMIMMTVNGQQSGPG